MRAIGRLMQLLAFLMLPIAMVVQLFEQLRPAQLLIAMLGGVACFYLGRMIEGYAADGASKK